MAKKSKHLPPLSTENMQPEPPPTPHETTSTEFLPLNQGGGVPSKHLQDTIPARDAGREWLTQHQPTNCAIHTAQGIATQTTPQTVGDSSVAVLEAAAPASNLARETEMDANRRWRREGRDIEVARFRDRAREEYERVHPGCRRKDAHEWAWQAAIQSFPPGDTRAPPEIPAPEQPQPAPEPQVAGLYLVPEAWPALPNNASLQAELGWVQAERLRVVEERGNVTAVHLERASIPPPSMAALGWLETSIRSYAKYIDIVSRALAGAQDEQEHVRRERMRLEDIRALLDEMHRDQS